MHHSYKTVKSVKIEAKRGQNYSFRTSFSGIISSPTESHRCGDAVFFTDVALICNSKDRYVLALWRWFCDRLDVAGGLAEDFLASVACEPVREAYLSSLAGRYHTSSGADFGEQAINILSESTEATKREQREKTCKPQTYPLVFPTGCTKHYKKAQETVAEVRPLTINRRFFHSEH